MQFPKSSQSLNRYAYVLNNPLSYTDPSGFGIFGERLEFQHTIDPISRQFDNILAKSSTLQSIGGVAAGVASVYFGPWVAAAYSAHLTNIQGGSTGDILKNGPIAGAAAAAGGATGGLSPYAAFAANIAIGTAAGVASGADFDDSFYASAFTAAASAATAGATQNAHPAVGITISAAVGGTASELSGGKFVNGAVSGAFGYGLTRSLDEPVTDDPLISDDQLSTDVAQAEMQPEVPKGVLAAAQANFGPAEGGLIEVASLRNIDRVRKVIKDINVDGPQGTRIIQFRYKKQPALRFDYGPYKGTHGEPRLHMHLPKLYPDKHIPLDPRSLFD